MLVGGFGSGVLGVAPGELQAVSWAQRPQGETWHSARTETGEFSCCIVTKRLSKPPALHMLFFILPSLLFLTSAAVSARHKVRLHPGLLVWRLHMDWEEVSTSGPSRRLEIGSGDLLYAAPAQTCLCHPQPGGHRVSGNKRSCPSHRKQEEVLLPHSLTRSNPTRVCPSSSPGVQVKV